MAAACSPEDNSAESPCSAQGLVAETIPRTNISGEAEAQRIAIIDAALACDFDTLAELADFDGGADIVARWETEESEGEDPLRRLVLLLRGSIATIARDEVEYRFPSAAGFDTWSEVPETVRGNLADIYGDEGVAAFESGDRYTGDVTALNDAGAWMYFTPRTD